MEAPTYCSRRVPALLFLVFFLWQLHKRVHKATATERLLVAVWQFSCRRLSLTGTKGGEAGSDGRHRRWGARCARGGA